MAITSAIATARVRDPVVFAVVRAGVGTSKKSQGFAGSRAPPNIGLAPCSLASGQPSLSPSGRQPAAAAAAGALMRPDPKVLSDPTVPRSVAELRSALRRTDGFAPFSDGLHVNSSAAIAPTCGDVADVPKKFDVK